MNLDIGCGLNPMKPLEDWVHLDMDPGPHIEITTDFGHIPVRDGQVSRIHIGDVIEHIPKYRWDEVLCEWNRISVMGGIIEGNTPNADRAMRDYAASAETLHNAMLSLYGWGDRPGQIHYYTFTKDTLTRLMIAYGFEVRDYSSSPGPTSRPWWLVFRGTKVSEVRPGQVTLNVINLDEGL